MKPPFSHGFPMVFPPWRCRRSPFHLLDGLQLAERQLQDLDDAMGGGAPVATALQVLLRLGGHGTFWPGRDGDVQHVEEVYQL